MVRHRYGIMGICIVVIRLFTCHTVLAWQELKRAVASSAQTLLNTALEPPPPATQIDKTPSAISLSRHPYPMHAHNQGLAPQDADPRRRRPLVLRRAWARLSSPTLSVACLAVCF